jgi:hypothetical protein
VLSVLISSSLKQMRLVLYMCTLASEDEPTQKKGFTLILFNVGPNQKGDPTAAAKLVPLIGIMPVKVACVHYCYEPDDNMAAAITTFMKSADSQTRARFRIHCGKNPSLYASQRTLGAYLGLPVNTSICYRRLPGASLSTHDIRHTDSATTDY